MAFEVIEWHLSNPVAPAGQVAIGYPAGRSAANYSAAGHSLIANGATYISPSKFTLDFGVSDITLNWIGPGTLSSGQDILLEVKTAEAPDSLAAAFTFVASIAAMTAKTPIETPAGALVYVQGYHVGTDYGGGMFLVKDSGATADAGTVFEFNSGGGNLRFHRLEFNAGVADVTHFGARGSGDVAHRTANTTAFQRAIDHLTAVSAADYNGGHGLIVPKGKGEYYIDGELTVPSTIASLQIKGIGKPTICQYSDGTGTFVFTRNSVDTNTNLHRHVVVRDIAFSWFSWQQLADFRSNVVMLTNAPDGTAGHTFGFSFENCFFERGRCVFTLIKTGETGWTDAETDAWVATGAAFVQSVRFIKCHFAFMSGGAYYVNNQNAGGPQLTFRDCTSMHGYEDGGRVKILEREFIYVNHAQMVVIDQVEYLMSDRAFIYCGNSHHVKLSSIALEFCNMADQSQIMRFNGGDTNFVVEGVRIQNCVFPADRILVATYQAHGRVMGSCLSFSNTHTTGRLYYCGRYAGSTGTIGWDAMQNTPTGTATCPSADNSNVTLWAPDTITNT